MPTTPTTSQVSASNTVPVIPNGLPYSPPSSSAAASTPESPDATLPPAPEVHVNGKPANTHSASNRPKSSAGSAHAETNASGWGANFWVTLADPSTGVSFYACPATGEVSWDPPVGNFLLPPSPDGEWWEMIDDSSRLPYYYHTKSGETVWERPQAFVIPLAVLQNTALARRLSLTNRASLVQGQHMTAPAASKGGYRRSRSYMDEREPGRPNMSSSLTPQPSVRRRSQSSTRSTPSHPPNTTPQPSPGSSKAQKQALRRSASSERYGAQGHAHMSPLAYQRGHPLAPIPGSPYATDASPPASPSTKRPPSRASTASKRSKEKEKPSSKAPSKESPGRKSVSRADDGLARSRSSKSVKSNSDYVSFRPPQPQSLSAALEKIASASSLNGSAASQEKAGKRLGAGGDEWAGRLSSSLGRASGQSYAQARPRISTDPMSAKGRPSGLATAPTSPVGREEPAQIGMANGKLVGREISAPVFDAEATKNMSPVKMRNAGRPILVQPPSAQNGRPSVSGFNGSFDVARGDSELGQYFPKQRTSTLNTGAYPVLPDDLASDIQQFSESQFARQYFSTHRTGFIFKRTVPVEQMMCWQKGLLSSPLLQMNKPLHKEAVRTFKSIQRVMGDKDKDRPAHNSSVTSLVASSAILEEERGLLAEGLTHGELRDEIYCQVMKQLTHNPSTESVFKGWQLMCVLLVTFPPSKNFEPSLRSFLNQATHQPEGRVDVMAKYCLRRLAYVSRKGPRGKPPTLSEIEAASDAAFHPSIFGESLDAIYRLQERNYPQQKVPIILPFLSDGILALGGTKSEGIFRVPGDGDLVSELKLRIDKGYYTLDGFDDPHVLASLLKLWLRELADPLVPDEMYNDCIAHSNDPQACVTIVHRLPTINRRVVLFVVSFLQLFLDDKVQIITKMTAPNLALVMAPNLLRCSSESMAVVFTNAQYEQAFVHNLLMHLRCDVVDAEYIPTHGRGAIPSPAPPIPLRKSKSNKARHRADS